MLALPLQAEQLSEGQPHKWEAVTNKSMYDFVADGFELKSVAYDTSVLGPQSDLPDVHYFLQKGHRTGQMRLSQTERDFILLVLQARESEPALSGGRASGNAYALPSHARWLSRLDGAWSGNEVRMRSGDPGPDRPRARREGPDLTI